MARGRRAASGGAGALVRLVRPANTLVAAAAVYVGALLAGAPFAPSGAVLLACVAAAAFSAAGNVRNDITDVEVDRRAHPTRPLVTGEVSTRAARFFAFVLYAVAVESAALVSLVALALVIAALPLMEAYERRLKQRGLAGNLAIAALTGAPFLLGGVTAARAAGGAWWSLDVVALFWHPATLIVALLAALATAGREVLKDVEDEDADRGHRETLPMRVGARASAVVAAAFLAGAAALSPLPAWAAEGVVGASYLPAVAVADAVFLAAAAVGFSRPRMGQRLAKLGMVAALVALVVGRATA